MECGKNDFLHCQRLVRSFMSPRDCRVIAVWLKCCSYCVGLLSGSHSQSLLCRCVLKKYSKVGM